MDFLVILLIGLLVLAAFGGVYLSSLLWLVVLVLILLVLFRLFDGRRRL